MIILLIFLNNPLNSLRLSPINPLIIISYIYKLEKILLIETNIKWFKIIIAIQYLILELLL